MRKGKLKHSVMCFRFAVNQNDNKTHSRPLWYLTH